MRLVKAGDRTFNMDQVSYWLIQSGGILVYFPFFNSNEDHSHYIELDEDDSQEFLTNIDILQAKEDKR